MSTTPRTSNWVASQEMARHQLAASKTEWMTVVPAAVCAQIEEELSAKQSELTSAMAVMGQMREALEACTENIYVKHALTAHDQFKNSLKV